MTGFAITVIPGAKRTRNYGLRLGAGGIAAA